MIVHSTCGRSMDSFDLVEETTVARYEWNGEDGEYVLTTTPDEERTFYACLECGGEISGDDKKRLEEIKRDSRD